MSYTYTLHRMGKANLIGSSPPYLIVAHATDKVHVKFLSDFRHKLNMSLFRDIFGWILVKWQISLMLSSHIISFPCLLNQCLLFLLGSLLLSGNAYYWIIYMYIVQYHREIYPLLLTRSLATFRFSFQFVFSHFNQSLFLAVYPCGPLKIIQNNYKCSSWSISTKWKWVSKQNPKI